MLSVGIPLGKGNRSQAEIFKKSFDLAKVLVYNC